MKKALIPIIAIISVLFNSCETVSPRNEEKLNNFVFSETVKGENKIEIPSSETEENELDVQHTADRKITNSLYSIDAVDGKYYLNFHDGNEGDTRESNSNAIQVGNIFFSSLAEMQEKLLSGDLSVAEVERLKTLLTNTENGLIFFDVNSLYEVNLPQGGAIRSVSMFGNAYTLSFAQSDGEYDGSVRFYTDANYQAVYNREITTFFSDKQEHIRSDYTEYQGTPCVVYEYDTRGSTLRMICMRFETEYGTVDVLLKYCLAHDKDSERVNSEVPYQIKIYGNDERQAYIISLNMDTVPTPEFLRSFSIIPFHP